VLKKSLGLVLGIALSATLALSAIAQDSRQYYKPPESPAEFWGAMNHEIELGQYKVAAAYLKGFLDKKPSDDELLKIQQSEGSSAFTRLLTIPEMKAEAGPLVERLDALVQQALNNRPRLDKLIANLAASPEERDYSLAQLRRSGAAAMPALIDTLIRSGASTDLHGAILSALPLLDSAIVPPLIAALDVDDPAIRAELIDVIRKRGENRAAPALFYLSAGNQPDYVRAKALETLALFFGVKPDQLPPAHVALTENANRYYEHKVEFPDAAKVIVWMWDGKQLVSQALTASQAEEYYGVRSARRALELDPNYGPAQVVYLSLVVDKAMERKGLSEPLAKGSPAVKDLLTSVNPDLIVAVLKRAMHEKRLPVVLAAVRALGELDYANAARPSGEGAPILAKALYYPDRRVAIAAADALLRVPGLGHPPAAARVVEIMRRTALMDGAPKALVAYNNRRLSEQVAAAVREAGYEPVEVPTGRAAILRLNQAADIDVVLIDAAIPDPPLPYLLGQLRADVNSGGLPILVAAPPDQVDRLNRVIERPSNVAIIPQTRVGETIKRDFAAQIAAASGQALTEAEKKDNAARAMEWIARLARGEGSGYDVRPATGAVLNALHSKELAGFAIEAAGRLPGQDVQRALAAAVLDPGRPESLRSAAAVELVRHLQTFGMLLTTGQVQNLEKLYAGLTEPKLKGNVALVMGALRPDSRLTTERLRKYQPTFAAPPASAPTPPPPAPKETPDK
jgi:CheY-like chemotaxis protein